MNKQKILPLQSLRFFAFLGILLQHSGNLSIRLGSIGCTIFFILSGYLLTMKFNEQHFSINPKTIVTFTWKRVAKLYPLHVIMTFTRV